MKEPTHTAADTASAGILDEYLDEHETAAALGIALRTLRRWDALREGPPIVRLGRRKLRHRETLRAWIKAKETTQAAA